MYLLIKDVPLTSNNLINLTSYYNFKAEDIKVLEEFKMCNSLIEYSDFFIKVSFENQNKIVDFHKKFYESHRNGDFQHNMDSAKNSLYEFNKLIIDFTGNIKIYKEVSDIYLKKIWSTQAKKDMLSKINELQMGKYLRVVFEIRNFVHHQDLPYRIFNIKANREYSLSKEALRKYNSFPATLDFIRKFQFEEIPLVTLIKMSNLELLSYTENLIMHVSINLPPNLQNLFSQILKLEKTHGRLKIVECDEKQLPNHHLTAKVFEFRKDTLELFGEPSKEATHRFIMSYHNYSR
jgi:hypothetical protein